MTGTDLCVNKCKQSRSYLNHLVYQDILAMHGPLNLKPKVSFVAIKKTGKGHNEWASTV